MFGINLSKKGLPIHRNRPCVETSSGATRKSPGYPAGPLRYVGTSGTTRCRIRNPSGTGRSRYCCWPTPGISPFYRGGPAKRSAASRTDTTSSIDVDRDADGSPVVLRRVFFKDRLNHFFGDSDLRKQFTLAPAVRQFVDKRVKAHLAGLHKPALLGKEPHGARRIFGSHIGHPVLILVVKLVIVGHLGVVNPQHLIDEKLYDAAVQTFFELHIGQHRSGRTLDVLPGGCG